MSIKKQEIFVYIQRLYQRYERLEAERTFLQTGVAARLAVVNSERQEIIDEVQEQLGRWNDIRVADGEPTITLQQLRAFLEPERGPRRPGAA